MSMLKIVMIGLKEVLFGRTKEGRLCTVSTGSECIFTHPGQSRNDRTIRVEWVSGGHLVQLQGNGFLRGKVASG